MKARQIAHRSWVDLTARAGYVARGLVFIIVAALLGITAAGLIAFGLYGIADAAYRRITPPARLA